MENKEITYTLITGASEGLGKAMALECAGRNMNLILVSLPCIELYHLSSYIRRSYKVKVCEFELDLVKEESRLHLYKTIRENNLRINILINNAGIGGTGDFGDNSFDVWRRQIQLNISGLVHLTYLFLPELKRHPRSYILNVSSLCIFFYPPRKQVYGATKSFIYFFSKSLRAEIKEDGVSVTVVCPGAINTSPLLFLLNRRSNWVTRQACMEPGIVAAIAIDGLLKGKERIIPGTWSRLFLYMNKILPAPVKKRLIEQKVNTINQKEAEKLLEGKQSIHHFA